MQVSGFQEKHKFICVQLYVKESCILYFQNNYISNSKYKWNIVNNNDHPHFTWWWNAWDQIRDFMAPTLSDKVGIEQMINFGCSIVIYDRWKFTKDEINTNRSRNLWRNVFWSNLHSFGGTCRRMNKKVKINIKFTLDIYLPLQIQVLVNVTLSTDKSDNLLKNK
jgi:hypothetical protein